MAKLTLILKKIFKYLRENKLLFLTIFAVILGLVLGFLLRLAKPSETVSTLIGFPGEIFMQLLKLIILPLIVISIISALAQVDYEKSEKTGLFAIIYYSTTSLIAIITGIGCAMLIAPGKNFGTPTTSMPPSIHNSSTPAVSLLDTVLDIFRNMFPENIIQTTFERMKTQIVISNLTTDTGYITTVVTKETVYVPGINVLGIVLISTVVGIILSKSGTKAKALIDVILAANELIEKSVEIIMWFSPIGITSMITNNIIELKNPLQTAGLMQKYILTIFSALAIHTFITMPVLYFLWSRKNPLKVVKHMVQSLVMTFGTSSSGAALPLSIKCMEENHGVDPKVARFILPLGCNINIDGNALYEAIAVIFIAQMNHIPVSWPQAAVISIVTTFSSLGLNSLPAGLISILVILETLGFPTHDIPLIMTVDWLIDRVRTTINVCGDAFVTDAVATVIKRQATTKNSTETDNKEDV